MANSPNFESAEYTAYKKPVDLTQSIYEGSETASKYLNKFVREEDEVFKARQENLTLVNVVKRSSLAMSNMLFRKPLVTTSSDEAFNRDLKGVALELAKAVTLQGHCYLLADAPKYEEVTTRRDEIEQGLEPYLVVLNRQEVINWSYNEDGSFRHLTRLETYKHTDGYKQEDKEQLRVWKDDGIVEIWRDNELFEVIETDLRQVPVVKVGEQDIPYLFDLAKLNVNHMNRRSTLSRYLDIAALPIPVMWGSEITADEEGEDVVIGVDQVINFSRVGEGDFQWREMSGTSTNLLQDDLMKLEETMLKESLNLMRTTDTPKSVDQVANETAEDDSKLSVLADTIEESLNEALVILEELGAQPTVVTVNRDFSSNVLLPEQVDRYVGLYREGVISLDTLWSILIEGEFIPDELDPEKEKNLLLAGFEPEEDLIEE